MDGSKAPSLSPQDLYGAIGVGRAPLVLDVRRAAGFDADETMLVGALRRDPSTVKSPKTARWWSIAPMGMGSAKE